MRSFHKPFHFSAEKEKVEWNKGPKTHSFHKPFHYLFEKGNDLWNDRKKMPHKNEDPLPEGNRSPKAVWNGRDNYLTPKSSSP